MGKIKVSNGKENFEIDPSDLKSAMQDGYKEVKQIEVSNGKEVLIIDDFDLENAIKDGYFQKKKENTQNGGTTSSPFLSNFQSKEEKPTTSRLDGQPEVAVPTNPIDDALDVYKKLNATKSVSLPVSSGSAFGTTYSQPDVPDEELRGQAKSKIEEYSKKGIDLESIYNEVKDLPETLFNQPEYSKDNLLKLRAENMPLYQRHIANAKVQLKLRDSLNKNEVLSPEEKRGISSQIDEDFKNLPIGEYAQRRGLVQKLNYYTDNYGRGDDVDNMKRSLQTDVANVYGSAWENGIDKSKDDNAQYFNDHQLIAYNFLQDTDPNNAAGFDNVKINPLSITNENERRAWEGKMNNLEKTGISLEQNTIEEELNNIKSLEEKQGELSPEQRLRGEQLINKYNDNVKNLNNLPLKYRTVEEDKIEKAVQELLGSNLNMAQRAMFKLGESTVNTIRGGGDLLYDLVASDENSKLRQLEVMGISQEDANIGYVTQKDRMLKNEKLSISEDIKPQVDEIINNKVLSNEEKQAKLYSILRANPTKVEMIPLHKGELNINPTTILNGAVDLAATVVPFIALEVATGGIGGAGAAAKFARTFNAAFATGYHNNYVSALSQGMSNKDAKLWAMRTTGIQSAAMAGAGTLEKLKELFKPNTPIGKVISTMTDAEFEAAKKSGSGVFGELAKTFKTKGIFETIKEAGKQGAKGLKTGAEFEGMMGAAEAINAKLDNREIDPVEFAKERIVGILNFGGFSAITGGAKKAFDITMGNATDIQKGGLLKASEDMEGYIKAAENMVGEGLLSKEKFNEISENIKIAADVRKNMASVGNNGKPLSERAKADLLFLETQKAVKEKALKDKLPPAVEEKLNEEIAEIEKGILDVYKDKPKEEDTTPSIPIEGTDSQGVPVGENVPPPTDLSAESKGVEVEQPTTSNVENNSALKDVESTAKALDADKIKQIENIADIDADQNGLKEGTTPAQYVASMYHLSKADGSNPELVKAVEDLLGKEKATTKSNTYNVGVEEGSGGVGGDAPLKENEYYHATDNNEILAPSDKGYKKREGNNVVGEGIYFGKDKEHLTDRYGKNAIKVELDIKNPLVSDNKYIVLDGREIDVQSLSKDDINFLKEKGYDAIKYVAADKAYSKFDETIIFDKSQIKKVEQSLKETTKAETLTNSSELPNSSTPTNEKENTEIPDTKTSEGAADEKTDSTSSGAKETESKEFDELVTNIPDEGAVKKYLSGDTIKKYERTKDGEQVELRNDQEIRERNLTVALEHGIKTIDKAKEIYGENYVQKTLEYLDREKLSPENKALTYVSLENDIAARILTETDNTMQLQKLQDLVRTKSQAFLRSSSLAINMGRLRKFGEARYDISKVTDGFFTSKELEEKGAVEKLLQADADAINKEAESKLDLSVDDVVEQKIAEGVEKEINKIYEALPKGKRALADKAIKALDAVQKKLRSKTYDATIGIPVAIIDAGITTIKNAIKLGVNITDAVELGIKKIKDKYGKEWGKEDDFRKDMLAGFKDNGFSEEKEFNPKRYVKDAMIKNGFGREITVAKNVKDANGKDVLDVDGKKVRERVKVEVLDWKKLAGEEGSIEKIKANVETQLKKDKYNEEDIAEMQADLIEEYNNLRQSIIEKGLNEIAARNKKTVTPEQRSAAKKLAEMYNFGLFDKNLGEYETVLAKTIGVDKLNTERVQAVRDLGNALAKLYTSEFKGKKLREFEIKSAIEVVQEKMRALLDAESFEQGNFSLKASEVTRMYMDAVQRMTLNNAKQLFENPISGKLEKMFSGLGYGVGMPKELRLQRRKLAEQLYKEIVLEKGAMYGEVATTFVNRGSLDERINNMSDSKLFHAVASTVLGKTTLDAVDSFYKSKITQQKFSYNLFKVLTSDRLINGKVEKAMPKEEAKKYIAEKLTGQSFKDAQVTAKEIIDKVNAGKEKKIFNDSPLFVDRLANDIVNAALVNGEKITAEMVDASYNSAYKAAGRGLGHVANNWVSQKLGTATGKIETQINNAKKEKNYNQAAMLTLESILLRNVANPYVGGGTNWVVLKVEKTGLGLVSGLGSMMRRGDKMDLTSETGMKNLEQAMYEHLKIKDKFIRGAVGGVVTALTAMALAGVTTTDEYRKWRNKNMWAARYTDVLTPELALAVINTKDGKPEQYIKSTLNQNDQFDKGKKLIKAGTSAFKGEFKQSAIELGGVVGGIVGAPVPWRLVIDGDQLLTGLAGGTPYKVDNSKPTSVMQAAFRGGFLDYLGYAPKGQPILPKTPETEWATKLGMDIEPSTPKELKVDDAKGEKIEATEEQYKQYLSKYAERLNKVLALVKKEGISFEGEPKKRLPKTPEEVKEMAADIKEMVNTDVKNELFKDVINIEKQINKTIVQQERKMQFMDILTHTKEKEFIEK